ncbi:MAG: ribonuclease P protein component [Alphaproteobacteria bacterium]
MDVPLGRLVRRSEYLRVAKTGRKAAMPGLVLQAAADGAGPAGLRVGITASRKVGNAVLRNRARRRLREAIRLVFPCHAAPGHDYVVIARHTTPSRPFAELQRDMVRALARLKLDPAGRPADAVDGRS